MTKTLMSLAAAAVIGTAGMTASTQPANAAAWWVVPAIVGGVVVGGVVGAAAAQNNSYAYYDAYGSAPRGNVYVRPAASMNCYIAHEPVRGGWRRVRVCE